ncbi:MAG: trypsin-like peptidase domain-containing protein [Oligoflexia bacterium]|nr:trypsin-like peptidase domain-containing protein [Oligoflexia bacterium]
MRMLRLRNESETFKNLLFLQALLALSLLLLVSCNNNSSAPQNLSSEELSNNTNVASGAVESKAIVGSIDWLSVMNLNKSNNVQNNIRAVGLIDIPSMDSRCTAFLISEDMIMTNWHCFPNASDAVGARVYFDFVSADSGSTAYKSGNSFLCQQLLLTYEELDVAVLKCEGNPGRIYGKVSLEGDRVERSVGEDIYVVHQNCDYYNDSECAPTKKYSAGKVMDKGDASAPARDMDLFYDADTLGGSSGSPVFSSSSNQVIALHHNGHGLSAWSNGRGNRNSGVPMSLIVTYLKNNYPSIYATVFTRSTTTTTTPTTPTVVDQVNAHGGFLNRNSKLSTTLSTLNDTHYYRVNVTTKGNIKFTLNYDSNKRDFDLYILNDAQKMIAKSESSGNVDEIKGEIAEGTYYIVVRGYRGATGDYTLAVE